MFNENNKVIDNILLNGLEKTKQKIHFTFSGPIDGISKYYALYQVDESGVNHTPAIYFKRSKFMSEERYIEIMENMAITITRKENWNDICGS